MATQHGNAAKRPSSEPGSRLDRIALALSLLAGLFLCFVVGAWVVLAQVFPYPWLAQAYEGGRALLEKETQYLDPFRTDFWQPVAHRGEGRHRARPGAGAAAASPSTPRATSARADLVAMDGEVVHEWQLPFSAVWDESARGQQPAAGRATSTSARRMLYPNGDLLAIYEAAGDIALGLWPGQARQELAGRSGNIWPRPS